MYRPT